MRTLVETQVLVGERGSYRVTMAPDAWQIPPTAQAILAARIDRLAPEDKRLLQTASVIGKDVPFALLQAIADVLNEEGVPTVRGGLHWRPSSVQRAAGYRRRRSSLWPLDSLRAEDEADPR